MATDTATKIQLRRDSSANWFAKNPVLAEGEIGIELDKNRMKVGNGVNAYNDLEYFSDTVDYNKMINKPQINGVGLIGNLSLHELGIQAEGDFATSLMLTEGLAKKADKEDTYTKTEIDTEFSSIVRLPSIDGHDGEWLHVKNGTILWESLSNTVVTNEDLAKTLETYALKTDIPTKTSELTNDSGFLTNIPSEYVTETELNNELQDKADKATTLSGYGISDAYTKTETDGKYATKTELATKADSSALPASTSLMNGNAPSIADFTGTDAEGLKTELNALLAQLKTRGVIA